MVWVGLARRDDSHGDEGSDERIANGSWHRDRDMEGKEDDDVGDDEDDERDNGAPRANLARIGAGGAVAAGCHLDGCADQALVSGHLTRRRRRVKGQHTAAMTWGVV